MPKIRGKVAHLGGRPTKNYGRPTKNYGRPTMFSGLPALDKFQSGPYAFRMCVVTLDYVVLVGRSL
jgi:hypothetical protein